MKADWKIDKQDLNRWKALCRENKSKRLVVQRRNQNVKRNGVELCQMNIWYALVGCQITTQQRSGPKSKVSQFLKSENQILNICELRKNGDVRITIERELGQQGLRRAKIIADNLWQIFLLLEGGEWEELTEQLKTLVNYTSRKKERDVITYLLSSETSASNNRELKKKYPGLGQKQSRNFIQWLGLSRYEIPLDSRVLTKLREFGSNFVPSGSALTNEAVYLFVQDGLQRIAKLLNIYPCELDACIFASFDIDDEFIPDDEEG